jgi:Zn finger protein HypA/HybF involved in hydrogenase expression
MRKLFTLLLLSFVFLLSGCKQIDITPDIIDVQYENIYKEGKSIIVEVYVTNGTDEDVSLDYMEFALYLPDEETEYCGAGFNINDTLKAGKYNEYEIEFTSEYIFLSEDDLTEAEITLSDLVLYFWLSPR